jgi:oligosaccharide repeat unit polymerase
MWRNLFRPEILFLIGALQAIFPYLIWSINGPNTAYSYSITYVPLFIWFIGYTSFFCGCYLGGNNSNKKKESHHFDTITLVKTSRRILNRGLFFLTGSLIIQIYFISLSYGYFPLQEILLGSTNKSIQDINLSTEESTFGQLGIFLNSLFLFNAFLLKIIIKSIEEKAKLGLWVVICIIIAIIGTLSTGKRQGLFMMIFFVTAGLSIRFDDPVRSIFLSFNIHLTKMKALFVTILSVVLMVSFLGIFASARVGSGYEGSLLSEVTTYLELPLINFEAQCEQAGLGPMVFNPAYTFSLLLPTKLARELEYFTISASPSYPEVTSPAGFYQLIHWGLGMGGVILLSFITGLISKYFYRNSFTSILHLLIYSQLTWALFSSYAYNHFLFLSFLPLPCMIFFIFHRVLELFFPVKKTGKNV